MTVRIEFEELDETDMSYVANLRGLPFQTIDIDNNPYCKWLDASDMVYFRIGTSFYFRTENDRMMFKLAME